MQRMQLRRNKTLNKADETAKWNNSFMSSYFYCNWKTKINFYGGATTNYKKNKGQGFTYYITKLSLQKKTSLDIKLKGNYGRKVTYVILPPEDSRTSWYKRFIKKKYRYIYKLFSHRWRLLYEILRP